MALGSNHCNVLALWVLVGGCAARTPQFATNNSPRSDAERRVPGVPESRAPILPEPTRRADSEGELVLLRAPTSTEQAREVVRSFLRAAVNEAPDRMELLLSPRAFIDTAGGRQPARTFWRSRLAAFDYTELRGELLFRESDLETFRSEDLARLPAGRRLPLELSPDEVAVRVPIHVSWAGRTRLFGDEIVFKLEPSGGKFAIAEMSEDFRLP